MTIPRDSFPPKVPDDPRELGLKYKVWREYQQEAINRVLRSPKKYFFLSAPCGIGKTGIAIGLGALLPKKTVILTHSIQLTGQYLNDSKNLETMSGRGNFPCFLNRDFSARDAPCTAGFICPSTKKCAYHVAKFKAMNSDKPLVTNYKYFLSLSENQPIYTKLLVCDEGHFADNELMKHIQIRFDRKQFKQAGISLPKKFKTMKHAVEWSSALLPDVEKEVSEITAYMKEIVTDPFVEADLVMRYKSLSDIRGSLFKLASVDTSNVWLMADYPVSIMFRPVWVKKESSLLFNGAEKVLIQSATLVPELSARLLGIDETEYEAMSLPSVFPADRRPLYFWPVAKMGIKSKIEEMEKMLNALDQIIDENEGKKGIIHTVNYTIAKYIMTHSRHKNLFITHQTKDRAEKIDKYLNTELTWLVSPSVMTGLDAPYHLCECQIICKAPFADTSDEQVSKRMQEDASWYDLETVFQLIQAYGRAMRDRWDYGTTWIIDYHFSWFYKKNQQHFPQWVQEAIQIVDKPQINK